MGSKSYTHITSASKATGLRPALEARRYTSQRKEMSPTIHREGGYRFFFFSREESRPHVHVYSADGEAKLGLEPKLELAKNYRLTKIQLNAVEAIIEEHYDEFKTAWNSHFGD